MKTLLPISAQAQSDYVWSVGEHPFCLATDPQFESEPDIDWAISGLPLPIKSSQFPKTGKVKNKHV